MPGTQDRALPGGWPRFLGWCALAIGAQAAQLGITRAGPFVTYQHIRLPEDPGPAWWSCAAILALQLGALLWALCSGSGERALAWARWSAEHLRPWQILVLACVLALSRAKI